MLGKGGVGALNAACGLFCLGRKGGVESGWVWRSRGGVCEVVRKLCEFVEDEWELVRQIWGFPDVLLDGFALRSLRPFVTV